ncbi:hypothetical protein MKW92_037777 [Papaver armeniacum]|nr:hypothetical protein MKW92_037777 [Papaver armeniacum]
MATLGTSAYLHVIKWYEARNEYRRKFYEDILDAEVDANVRDQHDGRVDDSKQIKGFVSEESCKVELGPTEVVAAGDNPKDYMSHAPWFIQAPKTTSVPCTLHGSLGNRRRHSERAAF